ncbi:efflux RND transporter periplasmic adaptor subunit [Bacteroidota bacterium]
MKRRNIIALALLVVVIAATIIYSLASKEELSKPLETEVVKGDFEILVTVTGELQALRSTDIMGPMLLRSHNLRFHSINIQDLIPEGTVVDSGDYVATLDRAEADNSYKDILDELEVRESEYTRTKLDTTIQLRILRDELINLEFSVEESEITLEQSQFEPPATIRQAKINLDKATRAFEQAEKNYLLKVQQASADMTEVTVDLAKQRRRKEEMEKVLEQFVIMAPAPGMVIYKREFGGQKRTVGSEIRTWDLTVATLPDMSTMISKTYVNEIDISKISVGQKVRAGVDAFPEKHYTGEIREVANIGEQLPNTDAKVFEVIIKLDGTDPILRPSMTTSNSIITKTFKDVLYIPLEAVHSNDSMTYVYRKNNNKQVVVLDDANENEIIVEAGLEEGDKVLLSVPEGAEEMRFVGLELVDAIRKKEAEKKRLEEEAMKKLEQDAMQKRMPDRRSMQTPPVSGEGQQ